MQDEDMVAQLRDSLYYSNKQRRKKKKKQGRAGRQFERFERSTQKQKEAIQSYDWRVSEDQSNHCSTAHLQHRH
mgnify:FL=1